MRKWFLFIAIILAGCLSHGANSSSTTPRSERGMERKAKASIHVDHAKVRISIGNVSFPIPKGWEVKETFAVQNKRYDEHHRLVDLSYNPAVELKSDKHPSFRLQVLVMRDAWQVNFNEKVCKYEGSPSVCTWRGDVRIITYHEPREERTIIDAWVMRGKTSVTISIRGAPELRKDILKTHKEVVQGVRFTD